MNRLFGLLVLLGGCAKQPADDAAPRAKQPLAPGPARAVAEAGQQVAAASPKEPAPAALLHERTDGGVTEGPGRALAAAYRLEPQPGQSWVVDFGQEARATLHGPARAQLSSGAKGLLLGGGVVCVDVPPGALRPSSGFDLATPSAWLRIERSARACVRVGTQGQTHVAVAGGRLLLYGAERSATRPWVLRAGQTGLLTLAAAPHRLRQRTPTMQHALDWAERQAEGGRADPDSFRGLNFQLSRALDAVDVHAAQLVRLEAVHRELAQAQSPHAMLLQREIAREAAAASRARRKVRGLFLQCQAAALGRGETLDPALTARALRTAP